MVRNMEPTTKVEVSISCRELTDMDILSKSDPICVLFTKNFGCDKWNEYGRTEVIWNNLNPDFVEKFIIDYFFGEAQELRFLVYDIDEESDDLSKHDFLGMCECTLGEIIGHNPLIKNLSDPKKPGKTRGYAILTAEELNVCKDEVSLQFCAKKLDRKDFFGKSDPFLLFSRINEDRSFTVFHRTEVIKNTLNPKWKPMNLAVTTVCNGDYDRTLKIECYDWNRNGSHKLIGLFYTNLRELFRGPCFQNDFECINDIRKLKKGIRYRNSGIIKLMSCKLISVPSFLDYIRGGTQVHCTIAIDLTASNGDPRSPKSLHYIDRNVPNLYARALKSIVQIIEHYNTDKLFPALGFGARIPPYGNISHELFLNGNPENPYCHGVDGVIEAYYQTLTRVQLYGPTNFAPVINHVANIAAELKGDCEHYFILLIMTDGIITDMPQTCEAIVSASSLPLSIVIVGIGDADFSEMHVLDGDEVRLTSKGIKAQRDIVQFVPFRDFIGGWYDEDLTRSQAILAKEVLDEIPDQLVSYMRVNNIKPKIIKNTANS